MTNYLRLQISQNCSNKFQGCSLLLKAFEIKSHQMKSHCLYPFWNCGQIFAKGAPGPPLVPPPSSISRVNKQGLAIIARVDFSNPEIIIDVLKPKIYLYLFSKSSLSKDITKQKSFSPLVPTETFWLRVRNSKNNTWNPKETCENLRKPKVYKEP